MAGPENEAASFGAGVVWAEIFGGVAIAVGLLGAAACGEGMDGSAVPDCAGVLLDALLRMLRAWLFATSAAMNCGRD